MPRVRLWPPDLVASITIDGFKSIRAQTLALGRLNVFIGPNGSGKTALLEAIGVLGAAAYGRVDDAELLRRGVRPGVPSLFKTSFDERTPRRIKLGAASHVGGRYEVTLDNPRDSAATPWRFSTEKLNDEGGPRISRSPRGGTIWYGKRKGPPLRPSDPYLGVARWMSALGELPQDLYRFLMTLSEYVIYDPQTSVLRGTVADPLPIDPVGLQGGRLAEAVAQLLGPDRFGDLPLSDVLAMIEWARDIDVSEPTPDLMSPSIPAATKIIRFADRFMRPGRELLSAYDASEGALHVLFALTLLFHPRAPRFFAVENIDHSLHPRLARALVRTLGERIGRGTARRQILLTTHNPLVLDGLDLSVDDIRLFTVDRTAAGHTVVHRVEFTEALAKAQAHGATLSQMWTRGLLGAVPQIA